jgi:hypothetical protein
MGQEHISRQVIDRVEPRTSGERDMNRIWLLCIALLAACTAEAPVEEVATASPNVVTLTTTEYAVEAPDTISAGWTTFRHANHGQELHYSHIVRIDSGRTVQHLVDAYVEAIRTSGSRPKWVTRFGGPGGTAPGGTSSVTQYLEPGSYVWICPVEDGEGNPHFGKGEVKEFVVRASDADPAGQAAAPVADAVIRLQDFSFAVDSGLTRGARTIRVENTGVEPHDLVVLRLAPGRTLADLQTWLNPEIARRDPTGEPPPSLESLGTPAGGIAAIRPGMAVFFETELVPGEYVFLCMATAPDGRSHIEHGMIQQLTVR